ncbi:hypothetical protein ACIHAA_08175 [Streptomyces sp. NPDC052040]|uniref:hypothetical protein n=1 Tax=Streptomyces sp. NPDC052040 TaxID=3365682 RepID=UPI0037CF6FC5
MNDQEFLDEEDEAFLDERDRIDAAPAEESAPPWLSRFRVEVDGSRQEYAERLRSVLGAALDHALAEAGIDTETTPREVPGWFVAACAESGAERPLPDFARSGSEHFTAAGLGPGWDLRGWLERFDLDLDLRRWSWWDLTGADDRTLSLWVDAAGEDFFSCDELRWAAYLSGARSVTGPVLLRKDAWLAEAAQR